MNQLHELIGKKIVAVRGLKRTYEYIHDRQPPITAIYILFDDEETRIELRAQDEDDYHDCAESARYLVVTKDNVLWKRIFSDLENFPEATEDP